jgi:hypothetical protein
MLKGVMVFSRFVHRNGYKLHLEGHNLLLCRVFIGESWHLLDFVPEISSKSHIGIVE